MFRIFRPITYLSLLFCLLPLEAQTANKSLSCDSKWKSSGGGSAIVASFSNLTRENLKLYWIDTQGKSVFYSELVPNQTLEMNTYAKHIWKLDNQNGKCIGVYQLTKSDEMITIQGNAKVPAKTNRVSAVSPELADYYNLSPFYKKYINETGIPILASEKVSDKALIRANEILKFMLKQLPQVPGRLQMYRIRLAIIGAKEQTLDIPEHSDMQTAFPEENWNERARGFGATISRPATSFGEENLLCFPNDRYRGENIMVHEFAHTIMFSLSYTNPPLYKEILAAYKAAKKKGLWKNTYAESNEDEYWAEGVQSWFDTNLESIPTNGIHGEIDTRKELETYDPQLYQVIRKVFGDDTFDFKCNY
ncbi:hypothetical protein [Leptospira idonii]|uniref:von Hippel-Lindau disease tumour suppressor beta domain-containing protein n=1 Tax=Leptospira idonii TaxID=1193500 RepID=A0A4R9M2H3_9LEPT|nr:hypothetical protein [Leptospira idonii]TGN20960.1 hypothetical protein EHS15_00100 [Leptospira idonii]